MKEVELLSGQLKEIEQQIVTFYKKIGKMLGLTPRATEVFAYLSVYDTLTQEQLKQLTGFSLSTISATLQSFLQTDIISRSIIPNTHKNLYRINPERVRFAYTPFARIIEDLEKLDLYIVEKQRDFQDLRSKYPIATKLLHRRLNSLRNYIEAQRRIMKREKRFSFFQEDVSEIIPLNEMIVYPFETQELERELLDILGYYKSDPIRNRILSVFFTHRGANQQTLIDATGFSRSTISRYLHKDLERKYIRVLPREYRKPQIYYLESIALSILSAIRKTDTFIFSNAPKFQEILFILQSDQQSNGFRRDTTFLIAKIEEIIGQIEAFKNDTRSFRQVYNDFLEFLGKDTLVNNQM
ncbi:MAG: helix-turn-helix domain-containing protein [Candidatus Thorarchaeota archaeon]|nr:helix-turn-helix domain-containing protein [Candidatus Thorarchaeota archaeon]